MKKEPWGLIIYNRDKKLAAFTLRLLDDSGYNKQVCDLQDRGYGFNCQSYNISEKSRFEDEVVNKLGYTIVSLAEVFSI